MFEHLNTDERIKCVLEMAWEIPIIHKVNADLSFETGSFNSLFRK